MMAEAGSRLPFAQPTHSAPLRQVHNPGSFSGIFPTAPHPSTFHARKGAALNDGASWRFIMRNLRVIAAAVAACACFFSRPLGSQETRIKEVKFSNGDISLAVRLYLPAE